MKKRVLTVKLFSTLLLMSSFLVTGCSDSDYDFNEIDATMGFGGEGLELPASSTENIKLKDVLELEDNGSVVADESTNFDYVFRQQGNEVAAARPYIGAITVAKQNATSSDVTLSLSSAARRTRVGGHVLKGEGDVFEFSYEGNKPAEVVQLSMADVSSDIHIQLSLSALKPWVSRLDKVTLTFPSYMNLKVVSSGNAAEINGNVLTLSNISTDNNLTLSVSITSVDFGKSDANNKLAIVGDKIQMKGKVHLAVEASQLAASSSASSTTTRLNTNFSMSDLKITSATGKFNPTIALEDLGRIQVTGVPDFLEDDNVVVDLYNPQIHLNLPSTLDIEGLVSGDLTSYKYGDKLVTVHVPEFAVKPQADNHIVICRKNTFANSENLTVVEVPELSNLIKTMPDAISFNVEARANKEKEGTFRLGYNGYEIKPSYSIDAPIAFAEDASIEYTDFLDGWNDDIKDYRLSKDAYIQLTANVSNVVPAFLNLEAIPVDVDGNVIPASELEIAVDGTIKASSDGNTPETSPLSIKITQKSDDALRKLDGIQIDVVGKAKSDGNAVTGITLNAQKHTLKLQDIKVKLVGKVIADFN